MKADIDGSSRTIPLFDCPAIEDYTSLFIQGFELMVISYHQGERYERYVADVFVGKVKGHSGFASAREGYMFEFEMEMKMDLRTSVQFICEEMKQLGIIQ